MSLKGIAFDVLEAEYAERFNRLSLLQEQEAAFSRGLAGIRAEITDLLTPSATSAKKRKGPGLAQNPTAVAPRNPKAGTKATGGYRGPSALTAKGTGFTTPTVLKAERPVQRKLSDVIYAIMRTRHRPMNVTELAHLSLKRGYKTVSNTERFKSSITSILVSDKRFTRHEAGVYKIAAEAAK